MIKKQSPSGITYFQWSFNPALPIVLYLGGRGEDTSAANSYFKNLFVPNNKDHFSIFSANTPNGSGWEKTINGLYAGTGIAKHIKETYAHDGRFYYTGWSDGGNYNLADQMMQHFIVDAFVCCAGSGDYNETLRLAKTKLPIMHFHGVDDNAPNNTYALGEKTAKRYRDAGGDIVFVPITKGDHDSAPLKAYFKDTNIAEWFLSKGKPIVKVPAPQPSVVKIKHDETVVSGNVVIFKGEDGKEYKVNLMS